MKGSDKKRGLGGIILLALFVFPVWYDWKYEQGWLVIDGVVVVFAGVAFLKYLLPRKVG